MPVLQPARTLVEKLMLVHTVAVRHSGNIAQLRAERAARHFYDIHCLLGHDETCSLLSNRDAFENLLTDAERISTQHFGGVEPRPAGGFAASDAFSLQPQMRDLLTAEYQDTMRGYYFGAEPHPSFDEVCQRVDERRELL